MNVVIYARVSTKTQDYDRQLSELRTYAARMQYNVVREFAEVVSGAKKVNEREAMSELLTYCDDNHVDKVLIYECSRLSRRAVDFLQIVEHLNERNISIYTQNSLETLLPNGEVNPIAGIVLGILVQFNSMERTLIRSRMESGYNSYRSRGGQVGRKEGYRKPSETMMLQYTKEISLLKKGIASTPGDKLLLMTLGLLLVISGPSCFIAWTKLRKRNLGPVLNANGWAINSKVLVNVVFGGKVTSIAKYPKLRLADPYKQKTAAWKIWLPIVIILLLIAAFAVLYFCGCLDFIPAFRLPAQS